MAVKISLKYGREALHLQLQRRARLRGVSRPLMAQPATRPQDLCVVICYHDDCWRVKKCESLGFREGPPSTGKECITTFVCFFSLSMN